MAPMTRCMLLGLLLATTRAQAQQSGAGLPSNLSRHNRINEAVAPKPLEAPTAAPLCVQISTPAAGNAASSACPPEGALFLPTGFTFGALLPDAVFSYDLSVPVLAVLEDDVKFLDRLVLPRKTRLVGTASTTHSFDRVNINFTLVVLPEGCEFPISAIALSDKDGSSGVPGERTTHDDAIGAHIALQSMLTAAGAAATAATPGGSVEGLLATNFTGEANQQVGQSLNQVKSLDSINVRERTAIRVFVLHRFLRPTESQRSQLQTER